MYIYHALINALSAHMLHINLNVICYTHVEHSPTKTIYIKYYTEEVHWVRAQELCESRDICGLCGRKATSEEKVVPWVLLTL